MKNLLRKSGAFLLAILISFTATNVLAQRTASVTGSWSNTATWGGLSVPSSTDAVTINNGITVTVDIPAVCASLTINGGDLLSSVVIAGTNSLNVTAGVSINAAAKNNISKIMNVGSGTMSCASIAMATTAANSRKSQLLISTGTVTVSGDITMSGTSARNQVVFSGGGILNLGGNISGGDLIPSTGTVNYNGTTAQTVKMSSIYQYYNLYLNNSASATLNGNVTATRVSGDLRVQSGIFSNGGYAIAGVSGKIFEVADGATFQLAGTTSAFPTIFTASLGALSTVEYKGTGNQTVADLATPGYGHLILSTSGTKTVAASGTGLDVRGNVTLNAGITFATRTYTHNIGGNWTNNGASVTGNSTINFNGTAAQTIGGAAASQTFYRIVVDNSTGVSLNSSLTTINNTLTINSGKKLIILADKQLTCIGNITNNAGATGIVIKSTASATGSLIHPNTGVQATVERYIGAANWSTWDDGWHFLSSPVASQSINTAGGFVTTGPPSDDYDFYLWDEPSQLYINQKNTTIPPIFTVVNPGSDFVVGRGYYTAYQQTDTKEFTGSLNVGNVPKNGLTITQPTNYAWHLLGNPYPCALTWATGWAMNNIGSQCQIWEESKNSYAVLDPGSPIPAMNGFWVEALVNNASLTIPQSARIHSNTAWYKSSATQNTIKLTAWQEDKRTGKESKVRVDQTSTEAFDAEFDAHYLADLAPKFYSLAGEDQLSVNTLPELGNNVRIPFIFAKNKASNFYIELDTENIIPDLTIFLTDTKTGAQANLSQNPVYKFSATEGDDPNRFVLHFLSSAIGVVPEKENKGIQVYASGNTLYINQSNPLGGKVYLFSLTGQLISNNVIEASPSQSIGLPQMAPGIYLVNIRTSLGSYNQKVVIR